MAGLTVKNWKGDWIIYQQPAPRGKAKGSSIGPYDTKKKAVEAARSLVFGNGSAADVSGRTVDRNFDWYATYTADGRAQRAYTGYEDRAGNPLSIEKGDTIRSNMGGSYEVIETGHWGNSKYGDWPYNAKVYGVRVTGKKWDQFIPYARVEAVMRY